MDDYHGNCTACLNDWHFCKACDDVVGHDHIHGEE